MSISPELNVKKEAQPTLEIEEYLIRWDNKLKKYRLKLNETEPLPIIKENEVINKEGVYQWEKHY